jgi:ABC-type transport system involved in cytochrome c biogenesis permease subunit
LQDLVQPLQNRDPSDWTAEEQEAFRIFAALYQWSQRAVSRAPTMIPADPHGQEVWVSPWEMLMISHRDSGIDSALQRLVDAVTAYRGGKQVEFDLATRNYRTFIESRLKDDSVHLGLEVTFNRLNLFLTAKVFYGLAFMISFAAFLTGSRWLRWAAVAVAVLGLVPHAAGVVMRMVIMGRPPVTNLYATFLFVGLVCVVLGILLEAAQRNGLGVLAASFGGMALLMVAGKYFSDGDTMSKVVAVLDSNFWLATHVTAITIGYAGCVFAGLIGHIYLLCAIFAPRNRELLGSVYRALFGMLAFGLIFSFLGTMLGGVWADQSWGRFWGWDPKENGALLIVLWCSILFHAKIGGMISHRGMAAGSVLGVIVVLVAWLGVNLLSVGLHSYGFTSGLATGFLAAVLAEILFVAATVPFARGTP